MLRLRVTLPLLLPAFFVLPFAGCAHEAPRVVLPTPASVPSSSAVTPAATIADVDPSGHWDLRWDRAFARDFSPVSGGALDLTRDGDTWKGTLELRRGEPVRLTLASLHLEGDRIAMSFGEVGGTGSFQIAGWIRKTHLAGEARFGDDEDDWTPMAGRRFPSTELHAATVDQSLPSFESGKSSIKADALSALLDHARAQESSAIVIVKDGQIAVERYREGYDGGPLLAMSGSKSLTQIAIGFLVGEGKLTLATKLGDVFPGWKAQGKKGEITIQQMLSHTSGLDARRAIGSGESIRAHGDRAKLVAPPGTRFQYNNGAVDLLAAVVKEVSGVPFDEYLESHLFRKLDVVGAHWMKDSEGTPLGAGELFIRPVDFAKVGQVMLYDGKWKGEQLLSPDWIKLSIAAGQRFQENCGLLWWRQGRFERDIPDSLLAWWREAGIDAATLRKVRPLVGMRFGDSAEVKDALEKALGKQGYASLLAVLDKGDHVPRSLAVQAGSQTGFSAQGWLGQWLVVVPAQHVVAVRMREAIYSDYDGGLERNGYEDFPKDAMALF
jgi:CubicO group peptidase (beta-lactamase class C family)